MSENTTDTSNRIGPELVPTHMADATTSQVRVFNPADYTGSINSGSTTDTTDPSTHSGGHSYGQPPLVMIWPGFGMGARYYDPIGRELASRGYYVATGELHGQGTSTAKASRHSSWGYHHLASDDYPRSIRAAKEYFGLTPDYPTVLLTHSMGGQIGSLFLVRPEAKELNVRGMMGVGTGSPYYKGFFGKNYFRLRFGAKLVGATVRLLGYQPDGALDIAGYGRQAKDHILEWRRLGMKNSFAGLAEQDMDYQAAQAKSTTPILLTRYATDVDCPVASCENLAKFFPKGRVAIEALPEKLGHNSWARKPEAASDRLEKFIQAIGCDRPERTE